MNEPRPELRPGQIGHQNPQGSHGIQSGPPHPSAAAAPVQKSVPKEADQPIELVADEAHAGTSTSRIHAFGVAGSMAKTSYKRAPTVSATGAIRIRSFHGRLSEQGLEYMDNQINEWLDQHPDIEIKQACANVGMFEGKLKEMALIVNIFY